MSYEVIKTIEDNHTDEQSSLVQVVEVSRQHVAIDFENEQYVDVQRFRFETGNVRLDENTNLEITRLLMTCSDDHNHGVYYQAPRKMELWEAMFAIGEVNPIEGEDN